MGSRIQQYLISSKLQQILYLLMVIVCCFPLITALGSLLLGLIFSIIIGTPFKDKVGSWGNYLLKTSVIGLGFGINIQVLLKSGKENAGVTTLFVLGVLGAGLLIGLLLKMDKMTALLIAIGTAICGGSAIAVVGSAMKANSNQMSISTGTIFLLNALALITFPTIGHWMGLSQEQFGVWAGIAIHDTSSVVGAATKFGDEALKVASITKMLRILWIIPVLTILVMAFSENRRIFKVPAFIIGFVAASCLFSFVPSYGNIFISLYAISKQILVVSLFVISSGVSIVMLQQVGKKVLLQAALLWIIVSVIAMIFVKYLV
ncbi:MAG: YeiH family protein [Daejeonella sp.]